MRKKRVLGILLAISLICPMVNMNVGAQEKSNGDMQNYIVDEYEMSKDSEMPEESAETGAEQSIEVEDTIEEELELEKQTEFIEETEPIAEEERSQQDIQPEVEDPAQSDMEEVNQEFEYIYIDSERVYAGEKQNIVVSFSNKAIGIEDAVLLYESEKTGEKYECEALEVVEDTILFSIHNEGGEADDLILTGLKYTQHAKLNEIMTYFTDEERASFSMLSEEGKDVESVKVYVADEDGETIVLENESAEDGIKEALKLSGVEVLADTPSNQRSARAKTVIALDPGHDISHGGTQHNGLVEHVLSLKVANYCKAELERSGKFQVLMTRTTNACPFPETASSSSATDIRKRVQKAAENGASAFISFHFNSGGGNGAEIIYQNGKGNANLSEQSKQLSDKIIKELAALGLKNRGTYSKTGDDGYDWFAVQDEAKKQGIPGIIIEHAFVDSTHDAALIKDETFLKKMGNADAAGITQYFATAYGWLNDGTGWKYRRKNGTYPISQWEEINGKRYYFDSRSYRLEGWQIIGGKQYYLGTKGAMQLGWQMIAGQQYYFDASGVMKTGMQTIGSQKYYFYPTGSMLTGWLTQGGKTYYFYPTGSMVTGWATIDGVKYYFKDTGELESKKAGWITEGGKEYYYDANGNKQVSWLLLDGKHYYLGTDGAKRIGWQIIGGQQYYFGSDGVMRTGMQTIAGQKYYFYASGSSLTGWLELNGKKYYFYPTGSMVIGKATIEGKEYYFNVNGELEEKKIGWATEGGKDYYYDANGKKQVSWLLLDGKYYYLGTDGAKRLGWQIIGGQQYYFGSDGVMRTGMQTIAGQKYYFYASGSSLTGWLELNGKKYYFYPTGSMVIGKATIEGKEYYFNVNGELEEKKIGWVTEGGKDYYYDANGKKQVSWLLLDGKYYYLGTDGAKQLGWQIIGGQQYYFGSDGVMRTGMQTIAGQKYYFYASGSSLTGWLELNGKKYYFYPTGSMVIGKATIEGKEYYFNVNGELEEKKIGWVTEGGKDYYYDVDGNKKTSWLVLNGKQYYLGTDGAKRIGWQVVEQQQYYFGTDGIMVTGMQTIGSQKYYFYASGSMYTGWLEQNGNKYYFYPSGSMATNWIVIGEDKYWFDQNGVLKNSLKGLYRIMGGSKVTKQQLVKLFNENAKYPEFYKKGEEGKTIEEFCQLYIEESVAEGVRAEVAFVQAMLETGWLSYTGDVKIEQYNFAGLGATGGVPGNVFPDMRTGIRAQIQHLKAYASKEPLKNECVDERFKYVKRGSAIYVDWLGQKENPAGTGWAASPYYGYNIRKILAKIS